VAIADLFVNVSSDVSGAISGLTDVDNKVKSTSSAMDDAVPAAIALGAAATAVGAGFTTSILAAADFEQQINGIKAVMSPVEVQTYGQAIEDLAIKLGKDTVFSASQAANAIEQMIKAGVPLPAILDGAAKSSLDLAAATGVDVTTAANLAATAMNTYHESAAALPAIMDSISNISNATAIDVGGLRLALQAVGPVAAGVGLSFNDTAEALGIFANNGLIGSDAGTSLKTMLLNLQPTTDKQTEAFKALGLITADGSNLFFDATGKAKSMSDIFEILKVATSGLSEEQKINALQTAFGTDAVRAATIAAYEGSAGWDAVSSSMDKMGGTAVAAQQRMQGLNGAMQLLSGTFNAIQITVGSYFLPFLTDLVLKANDVLTAFLDLDPALQATITAIVGVTGAVAGLLSAWVLLGPHILTVVESFGSLVIAIAPLLPILAGLGAAAAVLYQAWQTNFGGIQELTSQVFGALQTFFSSFQGVIDPLNSAISALMQGDFAGFLASIQVAMQNFSTAFGPALADLLPVVMNALTQLGSAVAEWVSTTGLPQLGAWAQAFLEWVTPIIPVLLTRLGELATAVFQWVANVGVPSLLAWAQAFLDWVGPVIPPLIDELGKILTAIVGWLSTALPVITQNLLQWASAFLSWIIPLIPPLLDALGQLLVNVLTWIASVAPTILQALTQWATTFLAWVTPLIPPLLQALGEIVLTIVTWVLSVAPTILNALLQWATAFLSWVTPLIPPILLQLAQLAVAIVEWIVGTALPLIIQALLQFATAFLNWVAPIIPVLIQEIAQLFFTIAGWIISTGLPIVLSAIMQVAQTFLGWAIPLIPSLLQELGVFLVAIVNWIVGTALPALVNAVIPWATAFIGWVAPQIGPLLLELAQLLASVAGWIVGTALPILAQQVFQWGPVFVNWVAAVIPPLILELGNLLAAIASWIITVAAPILLQQVSVWGTTFIEWVGNTIPALILELGNLLLAVGAWIIQYGVPTLVNLTLQWVAPFLDWIVNGVIPQIGPLLAGLLAFIGEALKALPSIIISVLGDPWAPFVNSTFELYSRIASGIGNLAAAIAPLLGPVITGIRDAITAIEGVILSLTDAWNNGANGLAGTAGQLLQALQPALTNIGNLLATLRDLAGPAFAALSANLGPFISALANELGPILIRIVQILGDVANAIGPVVGALASFLASLDYTGVAQFFTGIETAILEFFEAVGKLLNGDFQGAFDSFVNAWKTLLGTLFDANVNILGSILTFIGQFLQAIPGVVAANAPGIWQALLDEVGRLPGLLGPIFDNFFQWFGTLLQGLPQFIVDAAGDIWGLLGQLFGTLVPVLAPLWDAFAVWFGAVLGGLPQFVADTIGFVFGALGQAFTDLPGFLGPLWDAFAGWFGSLLQGLPQFVADNIGNVFGALGNAFAAIGGALSTGGTTTVGTGGGGTTGGTTTGGGAPLVYVNTLIVGSQDEANAFLDLVAQAVLASANRVQVPTTGGNPVLG